jgi:biopolymer transport protein ExbB/TolQ
MQTSIVTQCISSISTDEIMIWGSTIFWIILILVAIIIMMKRMRKVTLNKPQIEVKTLAHEVENLHREGVLSESEHDELQKKIAQREKKMKIGERTTLREMKESAKKLYDEGYLSRENYQRLMKNLRKK